MGFITLGLTMFAALAQTPPPVYPVHQIRTDSVIHPGTERGEHAAVTIPAHLYLPPTPPIPPGKTKAMAIHLPYVLGERTTNYYHASDSQAKNIELVAQRLNGAIVNPGQTFSYFRVVGPYTQLNGFGWGRAFDGDRIIPSMGGGVCQGASTLYSALLQTGLPIVERHNHGLTVPYLPPGEDATVAQSAHLDFRFKNNLNTPVMIGASTDATKKFLTVVLYGAHPGPKVTVKHKILATYPFKTIQKSTPQAPSSLTSSPPPHFPGQVGVRVETWVETTTRSGTIRREIAVDSYLPSPRVIERTKPS